MSDVGVGLRRGTFLRTIVMAALLSTAKSGAADGAPPETSSGQSSPEPAPGATGNAAARAPGQPDAVSHATFAPTFQFKLYSDMNFVINEREHPAFKIGAVDFLVTGDVSENFSVVSENVLKIFGEKGAVFDLDRIYLEWHPKPWFKLRAGRDHLMFGRYLQTYSHPLLFQLATVRPAAVAFEDEGGFLAAHQIGIEAFGDVPLGAELDLRYALGVGNGRGQFTGDVLSTRDRNVFKSLVGQLGLLPRSLPGFEIGVSGYIDRIPPGFTDPSGRVLLPESVDEQIIGAHVLYTSDTIEALAEGYYMWHRGRTTGLGSHLMGGFAQLGATFERWTPYARVEGGDRSVGDNFFNLSGVVTRWVELRTGLRYGLTERSVLKLEYRRDFENRIHGAVLQAAFGI